MELVFCLTTCICFIKKKDIVIVIIVRMLIMNKSVNGCHREHGGLCAIARAPPP
eukprot:SAG25_NODE_10442_length_334_cov_1.017021_2_plen_53_part_01